MIAPLRRAAWLAIAVSVFAFLSCAHTEIKPMVQSKAPDWCQDGSRFVADAERGVLVQGIGKVSGISTPELARAQADAKARGELSALVGRYLTALLERYKTYRAPDGTPTSEEEQQAASSALSRLMARSARIEDRFVDDSLDTWLSLAVVPLKDFDAQVAALPDVSARFKVFFATLDTALIARDLTGKKAAPKP